MPFGFPVQSDPGLPLALASPPSHSLLCVPRARWEGLGSLQALSGERGLCQGAVPMGMFSWQMASCTLEQSATSRGMTRPSPGAKASVPPRLRAPSTGYKVKSPNPPHPHPPPQGAGPGAPGRGRSPQQGLRTEFRLSGPPGLTLGSPPAPTDPAFVASAYIPESLGSLEGDDDKIYFFFSETGQEFEFFENTIVSRIARICKVSTEGSRKQHGCRFRKCQETLLPWPCLCV